MMKDNRRIMLKSMDTEIMQITILVDEMLERLGQAAGSSMGDIEKLLFQRLLLKLRDILDAEASVECWIIDDLRLGEIKGLIFEDEQLPRSESLEVMTWWRQLRASLESALDVVVDDEIVTGVRERINTSILLKPSPDPRRIIDDDDGHKKNVDRFHVVVGRQDSVEQIVRLLVSSNATRCCEKTMTTTTSTTDIHVIPVVGNSGIGKTTLAKLVYNDHRVERHFDKKIWVSFSNGYASILETTKSLLESATDGGEAPPPPTDITDDTTALDLTLLQSLLQGSLDGKKFLLVLDGVSNGICCDWDLLHAPLMTGGLGSRILMTTRSSYVSSTLGTVSPHNLQPLSFDDCWSLFTDIASRDNTSNAPPLSQSYRDMVGWFQGFPSLVIALGQFSHIEPTEKKIEAAVAKVRKNNDSHSHISYALLQTYRGLSSLHTKQCFLFCALFPKDYRFQKHRLVWLWMAEGFLQPKGTMTMEEVGFTYFEELLQASLFQHEDDDFIHHDSSSYFIPDLVQYMLQHICGKEYLRIDNDKPCFSEYTRHLSLCFERVRGRLSLCCIGVGGHSFDFPPQSKSLHTLLLFGEYDADDHCRFEEHIEKLFLNLHDLTKLRVLDISYTGMLELPDSICNLKHLRFLNISGNKFKCLPEKMCMLHNLQTLMIGGRNAVSRFPRGMGKLVSLRHLILGNGFNPFVMPPGIGQLTNLQTLPAFAVGHESDESGSIEELKELNYLRGSLFLIELENVPREKASRGGWLVDKSGLQDLELVWFTLQDAEIAESLLSGLEPHTNLKHLRLINYGGRKFPIWMGCPSFSKLETVELMACERGESLPPLGQLQSLKYLRISGMEELKCIDDRFLGNFLESKRFNSLKILKLVGLSCLEKWTGLGVGDMQSLEELEISWCQMLVSLPTLRFLDSLTKLSIWSCSKLEYLPSEGLPKCLHTLVITHCPLLSKTCKQEASHLLMIKMVRELQISDD